MTSLATKRVTTTEAPWVRYTLTGIALTFILLFLVLPLAAVFAEALRKGFGAYLEALREPDAWSAIRLTLITAAIAVPLNTRMKHAELAYVLNHSGARLYLGQANLYAELAEGRSGLEQLADVFLTGDLSPFPSVRPLEQLTDPGGPLATADVTWPVINEDAPAVIMYTSGTTARPKGVTHTHRTLTQLAVTGIAVADVQPNDVSGIVLPTCHIFGLSVLVSTLIAGNTVVMIPRFELPFVLEQLQQHGVTIFGALPVMLNAMLHTPGAANYDLSRLRACFAGGDAVPTEVHRRFKETFRVDVTEACGMTEVQPYAVNPLYGRGKVGSIGLAAPETTLRLVDPFDHDVETGASGEVLVPLDDGRLLERPCGDGRHDRRRLAAHGRPGAARRGRLLLVRRAHEGDHRASRFEHLAARSGGRALPAPRGARSGGRGCAERGTG